MQYHLNVRLEEWKLVRDTYTCVLQVTTGFHLGGREGAFAPPPPLKLCAPPWELQPFKIEYCQLYTRSPQISSDMLLPPLGDFSK